MRRHDGAARQSTSSAPGDLIYVDRRDRRRDRRKRVPRLRGREEHRENAVSATSVPRVDAGEPSRSCTAHVEDGPFERPRRLEHERRARRRWAVALAKSAMAGMLGFTAPASRMCRPKQGGDDFILYSESQGRVLVSVDPAKKDGVRAALRRASRWRCIGSGRPAGTASR
ncbi:MAG: hypothetical protein MZU95_16825 [Desulfomicrobium escambiense]|nr:hypothetical protein [Desulfomicrobium escambiense]